MRATNLWRSLARAGRVLGVVAVLALATGGVLDGTTGPPVALAIHEPSEPTITDGPWGGGEP